jgi:hypothetical protein
MVHTINSARNNSIARTGSLVDGDNLISIMPGEIGNRGAYLLVILISGNNVDQRFVYYVAHQGFGGSGFAILNETIRNQDSNGNYNFNSLTVNSSGDVIVNVTITAESFTWRVRMTNVAFNFDARNL